jgi:hypothetical protein
VSLISDTAGYTFQADAATLSSGKAAVVWTQLKQNSRIDGYVVGPTTPPTKLRVIQDNGGPLDGDTNEDYIKVARQTNNQFLSVWEDQVLDSAGDPIDTVLVQTFLADTGRDMQAVFQWDTTQTKYQPDIAFVIATQVIVAYETVVASTGISKIRLIRLRVQEDGTISAIGLSVGVDNGTKPKVEKTTAGGFFVTYTGDNGKSYMKIYDKNNVLLIGKTEISGSESVAFLSSNGRIVVVWEAGYKIYFRQYGTDGVAKTGRIQVSSKYKASIQYFPTVAYLSNGGFMITWQQKASTDVNVDADYNILACEFTRGGKRVGQVIAVHTLKTGEQTRPTVTEVDGGAVLFAWNSLTSAPTSSKLQYQIFDEASSGGSVAAKQLRDVSSSEQQVESSATTTATAGGWMLLASIFGRLFA